MSRQEQIIKIREKIKDILKKNKVVRAGIFGSYARGEQKKNSDVDILIEVKGRKFSLLDLVILEREIGEKLGKKVDLLTYNGINPKIKEYILEDEVRIIWKKSQLFLLNIF